MKQTDMGFSSKPVKTFPYLGGKQKHLAFIYKAFPKKPANHFVDVFGGGASVSLNIPPGYKTQTYNDINSRIVNFFRVLRERPDDLISQIYLTPYAREEYEHCRLDQGDEIERARRFYIHATQAYAGVMGRSCWGFAVESSMKSRLTLKHDKLIALAERLRNIQIENLPFQDLIRKYDRTDTLFYLDPPYVPKTRSTSAKNDYQHEMDEDAHTEMAEILHKIKGKAIVSGYDSALYAKLFTYWDRIEDKPKALSSSVGSSTRKASAKTEVLWRNFGGTASKHGLETA